MAFQLRNSVPIFKNLIGHLGPLPLASIPALESLKLFKITWGQLALCHGLHRQEEDVRILPFPESEMVLISVCFCVDFSMVLSLDLPGKVISSVYAPSIFHTPLFPHSGERVLQAQGPPVPTR